jgi:hypothetical protein
LSEQLSFVLRFVLYQVLTFNLPSSQPTLSPGNDLRLCEDVLDELEELALDSVKQRIGLGIFVDDTFHVPIPAPRVVEIKPADALETELDQFLTLLRNGGSFLASPEPVLPETMYELGSALESFQFGPPLCSSKAPIDEDLNLPSTTNPFDIVSNHSGTPINSNPSLEVFLHSFTSNTHIPSILSLTMDVLNHIAESPVPLMTDVHTGGPLAPLPPVPTETSERAAKLDTCLHMTKRRRELADISASNASLGQSARSRFPLGKTSLKGRGGPKSRSVPTISPSLRVLIIYTATRAPLSLRRGLRKLVASCGAWLKKIGLHPARVWQG